MDEKQRLKEFQIANESSARHPKFLSQTILDQFCDQRSSSLRKKASRAITCEGSSDIVIQSHEYGAVIANHARKR